MMNLHEHQLLHEEISSPFRTSMFEILQETLHEAQLASPSLSSDMLNVFNSYQDNCIDNASTTSTSTIINNSPSAMFDASSARNIDIEDTIDLSGIIMQKEIIPNLDNVVVEYPIDPLIFEASIFDEDCLSSVPLASSMLGESDNSPWSMAATMLSAASRGTFLDDANSFMGYESIQQQPLDFQSHRNAGLYSPNSMCPAFNLQNLQGVSGERQEQLVGGIGGCRSLESSELISTSLEDSVFKVGKLTPEERKEKIDRYIHKRNHRNFTKKIKYACRKTLADSRPRVRGRFAKNAACREEEYINEEIMVNVKEEGDDMVEYCSYIFDDHAAGVNSFDYNYNQIQSWV